MAVQWQNVKVTGDFREKLAQFAEMVGKDMTAVGAQAMAEAVYLEAKNTPDLDSGIPTHYFYGTESKKAPKGQKKAKAYPFHSGDLRKAIYQAYSKDRSTDHRSEYHVSWNFSNNKGSRSVPYGFMVEFGTKTAPAHPFLYPAFERTKSRLFGVAVTAMREKLASL
jgi:HK97 gp10 family phage protein